ncbi:hypothetical protein [Lacrimispora celerecrescens]|uniref:Uncharacterized protein n=1 Tax=[Clostridium] celerecrescens 18A TaxID=1286362 RepID=A0A2M8ZCD9_9FIRM|nr:hypothetical protein [Lacrimispora celerecrescens]PJJ31132.1 hypothetical protein H171_4772 [[Clostridium] celerecrescens 18A]
MSLIRNKTEIQSIKEIAERLAETKGIEMLCSQVLGQKLEQSTFHKKNNEIKKIMEYSFDTPIELQSLLNGHWDLLQEQEMKQFISVSTISAFKNKKIDLKNGGVSPYIYEF